jgi:hypothetical protein
MTEQERAAGAQAWSSVNKTQGEVVYTSTEIRDHWSNLGPLDPKDVKPIGAPVHESINETGKPGEPGKPGEEAPPDLKAAQQVEDEMTSVLRAAIEAGNTAVIDRILGMARRA